MIIDKKSYHYKVSIDWVSMRIKDNMVQLLENVFEDKLCPVWMYLSHNIDIVILQIWHTTVKHRPGSVWAYFVVQLNCKRWFMWFAEMGSTSSDCASIESEVAWCQYLRGTDTIDWYDTEYDSRHAARTVHVVWKSSKISHRRNPARTEQIETLRIACRRAAESTTVVARPYVVGAAAPRPRHALPVRHHQLEDCSNRQEPMWGCHVQNCMHGT